MTAPDNDTLAGLLARLRGQDPIPSRSEVADAIEALAAKDKARIERLEAALRKNMAEMLRIGANLPMKAVNAIPMNLLRAWEAAENAARAALEDGE